MSTEENKALVRRYFEEAWNQGNLEVSDELISSDCVLHFRGTASPFSGDAGKAIVAAWRTAFPDLQLLFEDCIAEKDRVVLRISFRATHRGEFFGIAPTGKQINVTEMLIARIKDGKVVEMWDEYDDLGMLQQLGVIPSMGWAGESPL
jgi:steroid delta-isomerase-like uncharacterized protein